MTNELKWKCPHEWLHWRAGQWDYLWLYNEFIALVDHLDHDTIQDLYEREMTEDGYFDDEDE